MMCHYFHPTITSKLWRTWLVTGNRWVCCFTSWVFFLISWILRHRTIVPCNKNTKNTLQHPSHMHSHVPINAKTNTVRREERINALQLYTTPNLWFRLKIVTQTFWSGSKNQPDIYNLGADEGHNKFQFLLNEEMHSFFEPLPDANNKRVTLLKKTKKNEKMHLETTLKPIHIESVWYLHYFMWQKILLEKTKN